MSERSSCLGGWDARRRCGPVGVCLSGGRVTEVDPHTRPLLLIECRNWWVLDRLESGGAQKITGKPHVICRTMHLYRLVTRRLVIDTRSSGRRRPYLSAMAHGCASRS